MENFLSKLEDGQSSCDEQGDEKQDKEGRQLCKEAHHDADNDIDVRVYVGQRYDGSDRACFAFHQLWEGAEGDIDVDEAKADSREDV